MGEDLSSGPTAISPDDSTCRNCGEPIAWSEYSYVHAVNGFADCGVVLSGGQKVTEGNRVLLMDPDLYSTMSTSAEPTEWEPR